MANEISAASGTQAANGARAANATRAVSANTSASDFFASGISAFTPATNQSTATNFNASDLQIGKATIDRQTASDITFGLIHQMGLARINLATLNNVLQGNIVYDGNTGSVTSGSQFSTSLQSVTASSDFTGTGNVTAYRSATNVYAAIIHPSNSVVFNSNSNVVGAWANSITAHPAANSILAATVNPDRGSITWNYDFSGEVKELTTPLTGTYKLQVWGACAGGWGSHGNISGGYSGGNINLASSSKLYIVVGGKGYDHRKGNGVHYLDGTSYNGGGSHTFFDLADSAYYFLIGGGGATHIASMTGLLKDLVDHKETVYIVAGGAGSNGGWSEIIGYGGGEQGGGSTSTGGKGDVTINEDTQTGGTQTGCGSDGYKGGFGYGADGANLSGAGCGGGGWYGGNSPRDAMFCGGGGSGYIGGVTNGQTIAGNQTMPLPDGGTAVGRSGQNGYAKITFVP